MAEPDLGLSWSGLNEVIARYGRADEIVQHHLQEAAYRTFGLAVQALAKYPPKLPGQRYVRTGDLGRGWSKTEPKFHIGRAGIDVDLRNPVSYLGAVQGERQARFHARRWLQVSAAQRQMTEVYGPMNILDAVIAIGKELQG